MAYDVRKKYNQRNSDVNIDNPYDTLAKYRERDARLKAIEKIRQSKLQETETAIQQPKAGDNRTTATMNQPQMKQSRMQQIGNAYIPNAAAQGMNTAANGADVDYTKIQTKQNGWQGLRGFKKWIENGEKEVSSEDSYKHATEVLSPLSEDAKKLLKDYIDAKDIATSQSFARIGNPYVQGVGEFSDMALSEKRSAAKQKFMEMTGADETAFNHYLESYTWLSHYEDNEKRAAEVKNYSPGEKAVASAVDVVTSPMSGIMAIGGTKKPNDSKLARDYHTPYAAIKDFSQQTEEAINEDIENIDNKALRTIAHYGYNAGMATGKSLVAMGMGGAVAGALGLEGSAAKSVVNLVSLPTFGASAYESTLEEASERGLTTRQAVSTAVISGAAEMVTEMVSLDSLWDIAKNSSEKVAKKKILDVIMQAGIEGSEEVASDIINEVADRLINADQSKYNANVNAYMEDGKSEEEAKKLATSDLLNQIKEDAILGALSGGVSAGGVHVLNKGIETYETTKGGRDIAKDEALTNQMLEEIPTEREGYVADEDYDQAQKTREAIIAAAEKAKAKKRISGNEARSLYDAVSTTYGNMETAARVKAQQQYEEATEQPEAKEEAYQAPQKSQEELIEDIEFASTPYQLATAIDSLTDIDEETQELIDYKREELKMYGVTDEQLDNVVTAKKAYEMGRDGEELSEEQLQSIPKDERAKLLELNNQQYNKAILAEHPEAVSDTSTGKYFVPAEVKVNGADIVVVDSEGNEHTEYSSPKIKAAEAAYTIVSKDANYGYDTDQNVFNVNVKQAALATELAIKSAEAKTTFLKSVIGDIFVDASTGTKTWETFANRRKGMFNVIDMQAAKNLYNQIRDDARTSDRVKQKNTAGQRTSNETVSRTLRDNLDEGTVALLEALGKKIGYNFVASPNKDARGDILPSKRQISIGSNNLSEVYAITAHEAIAEYLQAHGNEEEVLEIQDIMLNYLENNLGTIAYNNLIDTYQSLYRTDAKSEIDKGKSRRAAANEMFADTVWTLFASEEGLNDFTSWITENNTASEQVSIFEKIKNFFTQILDAIKNYIESGNFNGAELAALEMDAKQAKELRNKILKAMDNAIANAKASEGVQQGESAPRNSLMPKSQAKLKQDITSVMNGNYKKNYVDFGRTPKIYSDILGVKPLEMLMTKKHVYNCAVSRAKAIKDGKETGNSNVNYHNLGADILSQIPKAMNTPAVIVKYNTNTEGRKATDFTVLVNLRDNNNKPITVGIEISEKPFYSSDYIEVNLIDTTYGRRIEKYLRKAAKENRILYVNKTRSQELFGVGVQYPESLKDTSFFKDSLESYKELVNNKLNKKSIKAEKLEEKKQREQLLKVDDKDVVYIDRGISGKRFSKKVGDIEQQAIEHFGTTDSFRVAGYMLTDGTLLDFSGAHWLDGASEAEKEQFRQDNGMRQVDHDDIYEVMEASGDNRKQFMDRGNIRLNPEAPGFNISSKIEPTAAQYRELKEFIREVKRNPYYDASNFYVDIEDTHPNKISYANNLNEDRIINDIKKYYQTGELPQQSSLNDFRYSIKVDSQGRELSKGQQEFYKDNAAVFFDDGKLKNYYHGTRYAGFTQFRLDMMDDNQSIFLTDSKGTANTYSDNHDLFEPDKEWTFNQLEGAISYMTGGDWEVEQDDDTITITEYGFGNKEDVVTNFKSILDAQTYFIDNYLNQIDLKSDENAAIYNVYVKSSNPLVIDAKGRTWDDLANEEQVYERLYNVDFIEKTEDGKYKVEEVIGLNEYPYTLTYERMVEKYGKRNADMLAAGKSIDDVKIDKEGKHIPSTTRDLADYAIKNGYDSLVVNNVVDTGIFGNTEEQITPSQVVVVFNSSQVKSVYNQNPTETSDDIRKSIKVDWDDKTTYKLPDRTYEDDIFFLGTDEEIEAAEKQEIEAKAYVANIIHSNNFAGLMFKDSIGLDRLLTRSTRKEWDWQLTESRDGKPIGHENYKEENDDITSYDTWPSKTMAALYNEIINELPKTDARIYVIREGLAEDARKSIKVYGEASPYADSINETKAISAIIGSMNNSLSKVDAFEIPNDELMRIERLIENKYKVDGIEEGELAANISYAFAYMQKNKLDTDYEAMMNYLLNIGDEVIKHSNLKDPDSEAMYNDLRKDLQSHRIKLTDADRAEISNAFGGSWKSAFGEIQKAGIKLDNKNGVDIDSIFSEIKQEVLEKAGIDISYGDKPSQQILTLIDTMHALEPTAYLWDGANEMDKALTVVADIVQQYYQIATEQLEKNVIKGTNKGKDAIKKAVDKENARLRGQWSKYKEEKTQEFNEIVAEKNRIIQQQQNEIKRQNEQMKTWEKDLAAKDKELARRTTLTDKEIRATARLQAKQAVESYKDRQERAKQIENIKKTGVRLIKWLTNPTDSQHVPPFLQRPLGEFLAAIDFLPKNPKADAKSTLSWHQRMQALREELTRIREAEVDGMDEVREYFAQNIVAKDLINMMDDFLGKEEWDEFTQSYILTKRGASKVSNLDATELAKLNNIMSALSQSINNLNKTYANDRYKNIDQLARDSYEELRELKHDTAKQSLVVKMLKDFTIAEKTPVYFFEELGEGAKSIFDELRQGWNKRTWHIKDTEEHIKNFKEEHGITDAETSSWSKHTHKFELSEGTIELTDAQIMSLYKTVNRKQGRPHVMLGGIRPANTTIGDFNKQIIHYNRAVHINAGEYQRIISVLNDKQILMADEMQRYMADECAKWGNRVAKIMYGYEKFEEKDYFPLKTDAHSRAVTNASDNNVGYNAIKNMSAAKPIAPNASNAVMIEDIFDVFSGHVEQMANYDGFVLPLADAMRWFNYADKALSASEEGTRVDIYNNMQEALEGVAGEAATKYFRTFIKNINGIYEGKGGGIALADAFASGYKAQAVMANLRVVAQQPMAIARAADIIEDRYLLQALIPGRAWGYAKKAQENSALAYWKSQGYYETMIGQSMKAIITGNQSLKDKINEVAGWAAGKADDATWGVIYKATELKVSKEHPELAYDSEEYTREVVKEFENIIDHTQVIDTIFHKSELMRSANTGAKLLTAFMAEPTLTANIAAHRVREANIALKKGDKKKAAMVISKLLRVLVTNALMVSFAQSLFDALRDDDDEEFKKKILKYWFGISEEMAVKDVLLSNFVDNLNPLNWIPLAKEIMSYIQGYDASNMYVEAIYSAGDTVKELVKIAQRTSTKTTYGQIYTAAKGISQLTGMPISNAIREVRTLNNNLNDLWQGEDWLSTRAAEDKLEKKKQIDALHDAFDKADAAAIGSDARVAAMNDIKVATDAIYQYKYEQYINDKEQPKTEAEADKQAKIQSKTAITTEFKPIYKQLVAEGKWNEANNLRNNLLIAYKQLGDTDADKDIEKWLKE